MALVVVKSGKTTTSKDKVLLLETKKLRTSRMQSKEKPSLRENNRGKVAVTAKLEPSLVSQSMEQKTRDEMLEAHMPLVRLVAERIHRRLPPGVDLGSLIHSGIVGLLEA